MKNTGISLAALVSGTVFGLGLSLSGMTNPAKVIGFLDVTGAWDPSLAFVMGGALLPAFLGFHLSRKQGAWIWAARAPGTGRLTPSLFLGSLLFGLGWGLGGLCPGPALVRLAFPSADLLLFVAAMLAGMALFPVNSEE